MLSACQAKPMTQRPPAAAMARIDPIAAIRTFPCRRWFHVNHRTVQPPAGGIQVSGSPLRKGRRARGSCKDMRMKALIRVLITAAALAVATAALQGIELRAGTDLSKVVTLLVVALIFGVVNAVLKPIAKTVGCLFYVLTLGLIGLVVNALLFLLTS